MRKLNFTLFMLMCILVSSFLPTYAENNIVLSKNSSELTYNEDLSLYGPKRPRKKSRMAGKRGKSQLQTIQFGVDVGTNMSELPIPDMITKLSFGFNAGGYVDYNLSEKMFLEGGLYLFNKNLVNEFLLSQTIPGIMTSELSASIKMNVMYLTIPIQFGLNLISNDNFKFNFKAGPYLGLGISGTTTITSTSKITFLQPGAPTVEPITTEQKGDAFEALDKLDFGIRAGLGFDISKINIGLFVDYGLIKYDVGSSFSNVTTGGTSTTTTNTYKANIITFGLNLGYKF